MGKILIPGSSGGGVSSDDVTASKAQVLQGYRTITSDSNDEPVQGTMVNRGNGMEAVELTDAYWENKFVARMEEGYYSQAGQWKPYVSMPYAVLSNVIGVDTTKMLQSLTLAGKQGQIKEIDTRANNSRVNKSTSYGIDSWSDASNPIFYIDLPYGNAYYRRDDGHPHVCIDADKLGNATADKVVAGSTFASKNGVAVQGQIVDRGDGAVVSYLQGREDWANRIWVVFKNGWYHREPYNDGQGHIHEAYVYVTYEQLKNLLGIDASKMLQGHDLAGVQGAIPKWTCTTGDVISAYDNNVNDGFAWDDTYAGRGRGIVVHIPNGAYIQGANYVFLASPNLYPQNIREGVNVNGVVGTMVDYSVGRPVFENATFNALYVGGVANKDFPEARIYRERTQSHNNYSKYIGGTTIDVQASSNYHLSAFSNYVGFILDRAILFTFFRQLKVTYKLNINMHTGRYNRTAGVNIFVFIYDANNRSRNIGGNQATHRSGDNIESVHNENTYELIVDTSMINQDGFVALCADAYSDDNLSSAIGNVTFTKIELIN